MKPDCIIHPHDHRYQDRFTRCSARVWCYTHRTWHDAPRCFPSRDSRGCHPRGW